MRPDIQLTCSASLARLRIVGDLDISTGHQLAAAFATAALHRCIDIEADLSEVSFVDAYALGQLRREQRLVRALGGDLRVVAASDFCRRVCRLACYDSLQPVAASGDAVPLRPVGAAP